MTAAAIPSLAPLLEASPAILRLAIPRLAPIVATALAPEIAVPLIVIGTSYAAFQALYYWQRSQNDALQAKAIQNYCALNLGDPDCGVSQGTPFTGGQMPVLYSVNIQFTYKPNPYNSGKGFNNNIVNVYGPISSIRAVPSVPAEQDIFGTIHDIEIVCRGGTDKPRTNSDVVIKLSRYGSFQSLDSASLLTADGQPDTGGDRVSSTQSFSNLSSAKQQAALQTLTNNDWKSAIASTSARQLQQGETINQPVILSGNPNSAIPREREPLVINFPGEVPAVSSTDKIFIPTSADNVNGFSIPQTANIPQTGSQDSVRIQTPTGYWDVSANGNIEMVGAPGTVLSTPVSTSTYTGAGVNANAPVSAVNPPATVSNQNIWSQNQTIIDLLGALPAAVGITLAPAIARTPNLSQVGSAAETATCSVVSGNSPCSGNPLPKIKQNSDDILKGLDALTQAGQGALLTAMNNTLNLLNTKVGDVAAIGSVGGAINNIMNHSGASRMMDAITMVGVIHNALMLSNNIDDTLFQIVDHVIAIPSLIVNPKAETVNSQEVFGKAADEFFKGLLGVTTWEALKAEWKAANTICSTTAQIWDNTRSVFSDTQDILNTTNGWVAQLGNGLQEEGLLGEDNWTTKPEKPKFKSKNLAKLENIANGIEQVDNALQSIEMVTANLRSIVDTANEIKDNFSELEKAVSDAETQAKKIRDEAINDTNLPLPNFTLGDMY